MTSSGTSAYRLGRQILPRALPHVVLLTGLRLRSALPREALVEHGSQGRDGPIHVRKAEPRALGNDLGAVAADAGLRGGGEECERRAGARRAELEDLRASLHISCLKTRAEHLPYTRTSRG